MGEDPELTRKYLEGLERPKGLDHDCSVSELTGRQSECEMATLRPGTKNKKHPDGCLLWCLGSGGWIRTNDLQVMSLTSCHCSTPQRYSIVPPSDF